MIIDTHLHPISDNPQQYPIDPIGGVLGEWARDVTATDTELMAHLAKAGVDKAVLVHASTVYGYDNRYVADCVAAHPDKFEGVGSIDALAPDAPDTLTYLIKQQKMAGVRLFASASTIAAVDWVDSHQLDPYWKRTIELGVSVCAQLTREQIPAIRRVIDRFPDLVLVLDHMAGPNVKDGPPYAGTEAFFELAAIPTVYLKITTNNIQSAQSAKGGAQDWFRLVVDRFGPNRLMWGSNFPNSKGSPNGYFTDLVDLARNTFAFLTPTERDAILGGTAAKLYGMG